jgi:diacylglycerol kinase (ATP)
MKKLLYIINPNAGKKRSDKIIALIKKEMPSEFQYEILIWKDKNHFHEITSQLKSNGFTHAIAVGGDGTVNQVAKTIINSDVVLGILPIGSGNGLARSLGISVKAEDAIKQIVADKNLVIDHGTVNNTPFFCTSGVGFDAHIGNLFATSTSRGLKTYIQITVRELFRYRAKNYTIKYNGTQIERRAFLVTVGNAGQYGNDFYIAPQAKLQDGAFHIAILKPFKPHQIFGLLIKILQKKAHLSKHIETFSTDSLAIIRPEKDTVHYDGEPAIEGKEVVFKIQPKSLKVIIGEKFIVE